MSSFKPAKAKSAQAAFTSILSFTVLPADLSPALKSVEALFATNEPRILLAGIYAFNQLSAVSLVGGPKRITPAQTNARRSFEITGMLYQHDLVLCITSSCALFHFVHDYLLRMIPLRA